MDIGGCRFAFTTENSSIQRLDKIHENFIEIFVDLALPGWVIEGMT